MATLKQKKKLIDKIVHGNKKYKFSIGRYGGETVMGTITREQYEYWKDRDSDLEEYVMGFDRESYEQEHDVPEEAKFSGDWYEQDNVEHICGGEVSDGNYLQIDEFDQDGNPIKNADGSFKMWEPIALGRESREKHGIKTNDYQQFDEDHDSVINKCYFYGQAFNKGGWGNEDFVELAEELDTNKITLNCSEVQGNLMCNSISYEGLKEDIHLSEDSTGSSQTCCVREGWQNPDAVEEEIIEKFEPKPKKKKTKAKNKTKTKIKVKSKKKK